jgi:hypothetical protein
MAEADEDFSSYQYGANNPISNIDFMGLTDVKKDEKDDGILLDEVVIKAKRLTNEDTDSKLGTIQTVLDVVGLYPGAGTVAGILNAGIDIYRGNYGSAGINLISAIPLVGTVIKGAKFISIGSKLVSSMAKVKVVKSALAIVYGGLKPLSGMHRHHMVPRSLFDKSGPLGDALRSSGFNVESLENMRYLEKGLHGKHPAYTDIVSDKLLDILGKKGSLTIQDINGVMNDMHNIVDKAQDSYKSTGTNLRKNLNEFAKQITGNQ